MDMDTVSNIDKQKAASAASKRQGTEAFGNQLDV